LQAGGRVEGGGGSISMHVGVDASSGVFPPVQNRVPAPSQVALTRESIVDRSKNLRPRASSFEVRGVPNSFTGLNFVFLARSTRPQVASNCVSKIPHRCNFLAPVARPGGRNTPARREGKPNGGRALCMESGFNALKKNPFWFFFMLRQVVVGLGMSFVCFVRIVVALCRCVHDRESALRRKAKPPV